MRVKGAWLCMAGGLLWAAKAAYDWLWLDRQINRGYPASDVTDYIDFLFPLCCIGVLYDISKRYGAAAGKAPAVASTGLALTGAFHFSETYFADEGIPFGILFLFTGLLLMLLGTLRLGVRLGSRAGGHRPLAWCLSSLSAAVCCFCLSPFAAASLTDEGATAITVGLAMAIGLLWTAVGLAFVRSGPGSIRGGTGSLAWAETLPEELAARLRGKDE